MDTSSAPVTPQERRAALVEHLRVALEAFERGDETTLRQQIDTLVAWRARPLVEGLRRLSRELGAALGDVPVAGEDVSSDELEDACTRLDHVVLTTEQASHRTLDLADQCRALTDTLKAAGPLTDAQAQAVAALRGNLSELVLAQSYQDLTGQIIRRVATILRRLNENFASLGLKPHAEPAESGKAASDLAGPAVATLDHDAFSQNDADELLSGLGL